MTGRKSDTSADVATLEEMMEEVVETLAVAEQAAAFIQANSPNSADRTRAGTVRRQAEAMLDASDEAAEAEAEAEDGETDGVSFAPGVGRPNGLLH